MAYYFTPPTAPLVPTTAKPNHPGHSLFRHYRPWEAGINVWIVAGVVTTSEPDYQSVTPDATFLGGHTSEVTSVQRDLLVAAGYTVVETP